MGKSIFAVLLLALVLFAQSPAVTPEMRAREVLDDLVAGRAEHLYSLFADQMKKAISLETLSKQVIPQVRALGAVENTGTPVVQTVANMKVVVTPVKFTAAALNLQTTFDANGKLAGMYLQPGEKPPEEWRHPSYANTDSFRERDVMVGEGEWQLPGTLTVPNGRGPFPAVVLVHGSGPNNRDESLGQMKPFKDLAEGLASRGIVVLRYDKRTNAHGAKVAKSKTFTIREEIVDDALLAAALLRKQPEVDGARVVVIGHSQGASQAPAIAKAEGKLAGIVVMAGNTRPFEELLEDQAEYLASLAPPDQRNAPQFVQLRNAAAELRKVRAGGKMPESILGLPATYVAGIIEYDAVAVARQLTLPILILQGERDYQVTMKDFAGWKQAFGTSKNVTLKSYPALNHLFAAGSGKSTPAEYNRPTHVAEEVITDIADWLKKL